MGEQSKTSQEVSLYEQKWMADDEAAGKNVNYEAELGDPIADLLQTERYIVTSWGDFKAHRNVPVSYVVGNPLELNLVEFLGDMPFVPETLGYLGGPRAFNNHVNVFIGNQWKELGEYDKLVAVKEEKAKKKDGEKDRLDKYDTMLNQIGESIGEIGSELNMHYALIDRLYVNGSHKRWQEETVASES